MQTVELSLVLELGRQALDISPEEGGSLADACVAIMLANCACGNLVREHHEYRIGRSQIGWTLETKYLRPHGDPTAWSQGHLRAYISRAPDGTEYLLGETATLPIDVDRLRGRIVAWISCNYEWQRAGEYPRETPHPQFPPSIPFLWCYIGELVPPNRIIEIANAILSAEAAERIRADIARYLQ